MALFTEEQLRNRVRNEMSKSQNRSFSDTFVSKANDILNESFRAQLTPEGQVKKYDIFLSHSSNDAALVAGLKLEIEDLGYSVYIDWIEDPLLNRQNVTKETASVLKGRMKQCKCLFYAFSENAVNSKWMPWELGYFDGINGNVAVLPIASKEKNSFSGTEYLGLYYYIVIEEIQNTHKTTLWVHETATKYIMFYGWLQGMKPLQR